MSLEVLKSGFQDELQKISEVNLSGLSAETLRAYPQPTPMPSAAYEKAQQILARVQTPPPTEEQEKTADSVRPDQMPFLKKLYKPRQQKKTKKAGEPPPSPVDHALAYGGHTLAGAGAAKFTGDAVEKVREGMGKASFSPQTKAAILVGGAATGLANKLRKDFRRRKWERQHKG